ncbi:helix-turn-helix domain-containing protein [Phocaeicola barnesiae]|uniref:helix-turn-helix domain-containing protein n=1 Tax=Phocaeicola barnesiae TaxID=376804 RepID=UPI00374C8A6E
MELIINDKLSILNGHRYLTDAELAKCLKISRRTLQEYRNNGIIPYYHIGRKILYRE